MTYDLEMLCIPKTEAKNLAWDSLRIIESWSQLQCQERVFDTEKGVEQAVVFFFFFVSGFAPTLWRCFEANFINNMEKGSLEDVLLYLFFYRKR